MNVPAVAGPGAALRCDTWVDKWVEVSGSYTGSCLVEGRISAAGPWVQVDAATGGVDTAIQVLPLFYEVRVNTVSVASGTPTARLVGLDARTAA